MPVYPYNRVAEYTIKNNRDLSTCIGFRNSKALAVPAHTGFRKVPANGFETMAITGIGTKRLLYRPIVWQVYFAPGTVVKIGSCCSISVASLCEVGKITCAIVEVLF